MSNQSWQRITFLAAVVLALPSVGRAQPKALASVDTNMNARAELYECKRKQGVLTVKVRFVATGKAKIDLPYHDTYVMDVAAGKKYELLRDSDKKALATPNAFYQDRVQSNLDPGESYSAWWKFPAPPAGTKQITFVLPNSEPLEDVAIVDAP